MEGLQIGACFFFISLLLLFIALASDYWVVVSEDNMHSGLWRGCYANKCRSIEVRQPSFMHATRAFVLMGMIAGAVSFFGLCASFFRTHVGSISIKRLAMLASFGAGVCSLIAMSTYTGVINDEALNYKGVPFGWSVGLGWASVPLFLITGGLSYKMVSSTT